MGINIAPPLSPGAMFTPNELVFTFVFTSVPILGKIHQEMPTWECTQAHTGTEANRFCNLPHAVCYSYGTDDKLTCLYNLQRGSAFDE